MKIPSGRGSASTSTVAPPRRRRWPSGSTSAGINVELQRAGSGDDEIWDVDVTTNRPDAMNHRGPRPRGGGRRVRHAQGPRRRSSPRARRRSGELAKRHGRGRGRLPALLRPRRSAASRSGPSPAWLADAPRALRHPPDQQRRRRHQLRAPRPRPAAPRLRPRPAGGPRDRRPPRPRRRAHHDPRRRRARARRRRPGDRRRDARRRARRGDGRRQHARSPPRTTRRAARVGLLRAASRSAAPRAASASRPRRRTASSAAPTRRWRAPRSTLAAALIVRLAGGEVAAGVLDSAPELPRRGRSTFSLARLSALRRLPDPARARRSRSSRPSISRPGARRRRHLHGPHAIASTSSWPRTSTRRCCATSATTTSRRCCRRRRPRRASASARGRSPSGRATRSPPPGSRRRCTYAFAAEPSSRRATAASPLADRGGDAAPVANPLSARLAVMRRSLLAGLVEAAAGNLRRGAERVALGEVGRVFFADGAGRREEERLALALAGTVGAWDALARRRLPRPQGRRRGRARRARRGRRDLAAGARRRCSQPARARSRAVGGRRRGGRRPARRCRRRSCRSRRRRCGSRRSTSRAAASRAWCRLPGRCRASRRWPPTSRCATGCALPYAGLDAAVRRAAPEWLEAVAPVVRYRGEGVGAGRGQDHAAPDLPPRRALAHPGRGQRRALRAHGRTHARSRASASRNGRSLPWKSSPPSKSGSTG